MVKRKDNRYKNQVTLKILAGHLGLAPGTVSKVLTNANGSEAISNPTKTRIRAAARKFQYRPNLVAQSLRTKRTYMIGGSGARDRRSGDRPSDRWHRTLPEAPRVPVHYRRAPEQSRHAGAYENLFQRRGVEGMITVDADFSLSVILADGRHYDPEELDAGKSDGDGCAFGFLACAVRAIS